MLNKALALVLASSVMLPTPAAAQVDPWTFLQEARTGRRVTLSLTSGEQVTGTLAQVQPDQVVMEGLDKKSQAVPAASRTPNGASIFLRATVAQAWFGERQRYSVAPGQRPDVAAVHLVAVALGVGKTVDLMTTSATKRRGTITRLDANAFLIAHDSTTTIVAYDEVLELGPAGRHWATWTVIYVGVVAGILGLLDLLAIGASGD